MLDTFRPNTGKPRATAQRHASNEPRDQGEPKNTTNPAEAAATTARVRADNRTCKGTATEPPTHHDTEPPEPTKADTEATAGTTDNSAASAPTQQPTTNDAPPAARSDTTRATKATPDAGNTREPATATTPGKLNT